MNWRSLSQTTRYTLALPLVVFALSALPSESLATTLPAIVVMPVSDSTLSSSYAVDVTLNTANESIAAMEVSLTFPTNLTYVRSDAASSSFPIDVTPVTVTGQVLRFKRASLVKGGVSGSSEPVLRLTFSHSDSQPPSLQINLAESKLIRYSDSVDILHLPPVAVANQKASPTPLPIASPVPLLALMGGIGGLVAMGVFGYMYQLKKRSR